MTAIEGYRTPPQHIIDLAREHADEDEANVARLLAIADREWEHSDGAWPRFPQARTVAE